ncbi:MAG: hypothetical protein KDA61_11410 [Planctomycetales bacterium]|nr:hypothetical protein [Planctomycetales bacterium]
MIRRSLRHTAAWFQFLPAALAWGWLLFAPTTVISAERIPQSNHPSETLAPQRATKELPDELLPNAMQIAPEIFSGGQPHGDQAFAALQRAGFRTLISVDGATPDVEAASSHGLRYVHLPFGYDGIGSARRLDLAKALRDLPKPLYVHCHHGKHRSPAAAISGCRLLGLITPEQARRALAAAGTSPHYVGLFQAVANSTPLPPAEIDAHAVDFRATLPIPAMAEAMVELEHEFDRLSLLHDADWRVPAEHDDLDPAHEALLVREHFAELLRTKEAARKQPEFLVMLRHSEQTSAALEGLLRASVLDLEATRRQFQLLKADCKACHLKFRDVPQD